MQVWEGKQSSENFQLRYAKNIERQYLFALIIEGERRTFQKRYQQLKPTKLYNMEDSDLAILFFDVCSYQQPKRISLDCLGQEQLVGFKIFKQNFKIKIHLIIVNSQQGLFKLLQSSEDKIVITVLTISIILQLFLQQIRIFSLSKQWFCNEFNLVHDERSLFHNFSWPGVHFKTLCISIKYFICLSHFGSFKSNQILPQQFRYCLYFEIPIPGIASPIQSLLSTIIYMDVLLTDEWLSALLENSIKPSEMEDDSPVNLFLESQGFKSKLLLQNLTGNTNRLADRYI